MTLEEFVNGKQSDWSELNRLLSRMGSGNVSVLSASEIDRLGYLYRRVTSDLAIARRDFPNDRAIRYLNDLATRTHATIYQTQPLKKNTFRDFFRVGFPQLFREHFIFIATAFLLFATTFAATYLVVLADPEFGERLVPDRLVETIKRKEMWTNIPEAQRNIAASFIMTNNIQVAFLAFALGVTFTLGTVYVLLTNGALLGAVGGLCHVHGLALPLWSFVSPHGYIELTVIFIAGGAGLKMGYALIAPKLST
ncbi:stage II sporulation protein M, partial [Candidatus Poribacteria bacterium]|nr:stage II sporulation protein M [Candidatus Poribacteria bacterium]